MSFWRLIAVAAALVGGVAIEGVQAQEWGSYAFVSSTMGVAGNRICTGEASRGDIGCLANAPYVNPANGWMGLGTAVPSSTLHVMGSIGAQDKYTLRRPLDGSYTGVLSTDLYSSTLVIKGMNSGLVPSSPSIVFFGTNNVPFMSIFASGTTAGAQVGIARSDAQPSTTLDVGGSLKIADGGEACDANRAGAIRYTSASVFQFCSGSAWQTTSQLASLGGGTNDRITSGTTNVVANNDTGYVSFTSGGTTTGYYSPGGIFGAVGISTTSNQASFTTAYASGKIGIGPGSFAYGSGAALTTSGSAAGIQVGSNNGRMIDIYPVGASINFYGIGGTVTGDNFHINRATPGQNLLINSDGTGRVGIGTPSLTTPSATLHVSGTGYFTGKVGIGTSDPSTALHVMANSNNPLWADASPSPTQNTTYEVMRLGKDYNQQSPLYSVYVSDTASGYASYRLHAQGRYSSDIRFSRAAAGGDKNMFRVTGSDNLGHTLALYTSQTNVDQIKFATDADSYINNAYKFGIGTDSPSSTLHVVSGSVMAGASNGYNSSLNSIELKALYNGVGSPLYLNASYGGDIFAGAKTSKIGVAMGGGVPSTSLHVSGTIRIADGGETCDGNRAGAIRYTSASVFQFCSGSVWQTTSELANAGGGSSDRITSGTTNVVANSDTGYVSFTSGGVTTGYYSPGGIFGAVGISTTSNQASFTTVYASGVLSVGTSSTNNTVNIRGNPVTQMAFGQTGSSPYGLLGADSSGFVRLGSSAVNGGGALMVSSTSVEKLRWNATGVGIGTTDPSTALHVMANGNGPLWADAVPSPTANTTYEVMRLGKNYNQTLPLYSVYVSDTGGVANYRLHAPVRYVADIRFSRSSTGGDRNMFRVSGQDTTGHTLALYASQTAVDAVRFSTDADSYINNTYNFGIGLSTPLYPLHVRTSSPTAMIAMDRGGANSAYGIAVFGAPTQMSLGPIDSAGNIYYGLNIVSNTNQTQFGFRVTNPSTSVQMAGALRIGADTGISATMDTCDANRAGAIRFNGTAFQVCYGSGGWALLSSAAVSGTGGAESLALTDLSDGYASSTLNSMYLGDRAGISYSTTVTNSTAVGINALNNAVAGSYNNTAFGSRAMYLTTTGANNTGVGMNALYFNTTGYHNTALGSYAMYNNTTGYYNTATGVSALTANTTGQNNTAMGVGALYVNVTGSNNTAVGNSALRGNQNGSGNTAIGVMAISGSGIGDITGTTAIGYGAGYNLTTNGNYNTMLGYNAGRFVTTGSFNILIGMDVSTPIVSNNQRLNIGNSIFGNMTSATGVVGGAANIGINFVTPTNALEVSGTVSATRYVGDGSGLTGVVAAGSDRITSGTTNVVANSDTGYVSFTSSGVTTGYYSPGGILGVVGISATTNQASFTTAYASQGIGIGTVPSSTAALDISSSAAVVARFGSNNSRFIDINPKFASIDLYGVNGAATGNNVFLNRMAAGNNLLINPDGIGKVGIGTTSNSAPSATLHVSGTVRIGSPQTYLDIGIASASNNGDVLLSVPTGGLYLNGSYASTNSLYTSSGFIRANSTSDTVFSGTGKFGIGMTNRTDVPSATLHVMGDARVGSVTGTGIVLSGAEVRAVSGSGTSDLYLNTTQTNRYVFVGGGGTTRIAMAMGANPPSTTLHVSGTIRIADGGETCDSNRSGSIKWNGTEFQVCYGSGGWATLANSTTSGTTGVVDDRIVSGTNSVAVNSSNYISFTVAGSERMTLNGGGNLALNGTLNTNTSGTAAAAMELGTGATANKFAYLDFTGDTTYSDYGMRIIRNNGGANTSSSIFTRGTGGLYLTNVEPAPIYFATSNTVRLFISDTGLVGVNTNSPSKTLTVNGDTSLLGNLYLDKSYTDIYLKTGLLRIAGDSASSSIVGLNNHLVLGTTRASGSGEDNVYFRRTSLISGTSYDWMTMDALSGNIGIRTSGTPLAALHVSGTGYFSGNVGLGTSDPSNTLHVMGTGIRLGTFGFANNPGVTFVESSGVNYNLRPLSSGGAFGFTHNASTLWSFRFYGSNSPTAIMVNSSAMPSTTLHVSGTIQMADSGETCDAYRAGAVKWNGTQFQVCYGSGGWATLSSAATSGTSVASGDNITSGTTNVTANTNGYISLTTGSVNTGYFDTAGRLVVPGISATTNQASFTTAYASKNLGIGTVPVSSWALDISGTNPNVRIGSGNDRRITIDPGSASLNFNGAGNSSTGDWFNINRGAPNMDLLLNPAGTGRVGINTSILTTPSATLHVSGTGMFEGNVGINTAPTTTAVLYANGAIRTSSGFIINNRGSMTYGLSTNDINLASNGDTYLSVGNGKGVAINTGGSNAIFTPSATLHVSGTGVFTGNVGIGVLASNSLPLYVSSTNQSIVARFSSGVNGRYWDINSGQASLDFYDPIGGTTWYNINRGNPNLNLNINPLGTGRVGINTSIDNPSTTLHVSGTIRIANGGETCDSNRAGAMRYTSANEFQVCYGSGGWATLSNSTTSGTTGVVSDRITSGTTSVLALNNSAVSFITANVERMNLGTNGALNIMNPAGLSNIEVGTGVSSSQFAFIDLTGDTTYTDFGMRLIRDNTGPNATSSIITRGTGGLVLRNTESAPISFMTSSTTRMTISSPGNVGIGTSAPSQTLTVTGNAAVSGTIQLSGQSGDSCAGMGNHGTLRIDPATGHLQICRAY